MNLSRNPDLNEHSAVRLIVEAICSACGPLANSPAEGVFAVILAKDHTALTGHVVILNGTSDLPKKDERPLPGEHHEL